MPAAPIPAGASAQSAIGNLLAGNPGGGGGGVDEVEAKLQGLASQTSDIRKQLDAIAADFPAAGQKIGQMQALLKQIVIDVAQAMPTATTSGMAVPGGPSMGAGPV